MVRRETARGRRPAARNPRRTVLVVIGAERTESAYLRGLRDHFRLATVTMKIAEKPGSPDQLVDYARGAFPLDDFDEVWCVTDVDHYEREGGKVTAAMAMAAESGINVAVSNPCFELWLLLHHQGCSAHCANCGAVETKLKRWIPAYDKTRLRFRDFVDGLEAASARARELEPTGLAHDRNPSTGIWRLIGTVLENE